MKMLNGDVVLVPKWTPMTVPSGAVFQTCHTVAVKLTATDTEKGTVTWHEDGMNKTVPADKVRVLPCCWIIGQGINIPMKIQDLIKEPLAGLGVEVFYIPMSRISGLVNCLDEDLAAEVHATVAEICKDIPGFFVH